VLDAYGFPDVHGKRVIDIGRASGFFSFEFERRGAAQVVAVDMPPTRQKTRGDHPTSCWVPNIPCLMEMACRAGFARATLVTRRLLLRRTGRPAVPHAVVHALRE
jgi:hypothetical protein